MSDATQRNRKRIRNGILLSCVHAQYGLHFDDSQRTILCLLRYVFYINIYIWRLEEKHVECIFHCTNSVLVVLEEEMVDDSEWVGSIATNERTHVTADDTQTRENMLSSRRIRTSMSSINWLE